MSALNPLRKFVEKSLAYPDWLAYFIITTMFRFKVKLVGTAGLKIINTDLKSATFLQKNHRKVQNHIGSIHAAGMALLAESATGFLVGINLPKNKLPLMKSMHLKYVKRANGDMRAVARLTDQQISSMQTQSKGDVLVEVTVTDETGQEPVICEMLWAWVEIKSK